MPLPKGKTMEELGIKPGENLRFCEDYDSWKRGAVVTVTGPYFHSHKVVEFEDRYGERGGAYLHRFERIESPPDKPERQPKVGDRIRVTKYYHRVRDKNMEGLATIITVDECGLNYQLDNGTSGFIITVDGQDEWEFVDEPDPRLSIDSHNTAPSTSFRMTYLPPSAQEVENRLRTAFDSPGLQWIPKEPHQTITTKKGGTIVQKLTLLAKKAFDKETKTLIKAGVLDSDLNVRDSQFVLSYLVDQHKAELAKAAQAVLDEEKSDK